MDKIVLLCSEPSDKICHIHIVSQWLGENTVRKLEECAIEQKKMSLFE